MKKNQFIASFFIVGIVLGIFVVSQFNSDMAYSGNYPSDEIQARQELVKSFLDEQSYLQSRIVNLRKQVDELQESIDLQSQTSNLALLESLKKSIGLTEINGKGLEIVLDDSPYLNRVDNTVTVKELVQASDIRDITNALFTAHAGAIAINNQRVLPSSAISSVGNNILVNNAHVAPPFVINAVGDTELLLRSLTNRNLLSDLYDRIQYSKIDFTITIRESMTIPIYNGDIRSEYINLVD